MELISVVQGNDMQIHYNARTLSGIHTIHIAYSGYNANKQQVANLFYYNIKNETL